ncbi:MAG TPA: YkgJ family cysteine cluster protein [Phycisphaerae bacterium]|nr:YkgJ family cysteine cluster protein [Phycisphaerae bacterium]
MDKQPKSLPVLNQAEPWYSQGLRFRCTQCGNCCGGSPGYVWVTPENMRQIADYLKLDFEDFTHRHVRHFKQGYSLIEKPNYDCIFLERTGGKATCRIYPVRPAQCRTWPFWKQNLKSETSWTRAAQTCPGIRDATAPRYELEQIEKRKNHPESP